MSDHENLMKRCQRGATNLNDANNLLAECYGTLGAMAAEIIRIKAENESLRNDLGSHQRMLVQAASDIGGIGDALGAEMDDDPSEIQGLANELRKDADRLDWLNKRAMPVVEGQSMSQPEGELWGYDWAVAGQCSTVREAIDDAIALEDGK